ncbi:MAG TPA: helix-turn-helix transcriptional regulator [Pseudonocardiaceae bacterium]|jgi:transcriptional regulator with XRE-family HTH domain|nr:helix-turn-helix transcriptional regulator [Pseudonocardiaceae bacterium]
MTTPPNPSIQRRQLGNELRKLREATGLTQEQAAQSLGKAANKISRVETGQVGISKTDLDELLRLYQASEKDAAWCRELAVGSRRRRTRATAETTLYLGPKWFRAFRDLEQGASQIMQVGSEIVPGNLQTESYTRAMFLSQGSHADHKTMEDTVRVRRDRQALLTRDGAAQFTFVLSESVLRRVIGGPKVMAEQVRHLAELALRPNVDIQVVPFDTLSYEPLGYDFHVLRFDYDSATDIVYVELYDDGLCLDKPETVRRYVELQRRLQAIALGPVESRNLIVELAGQFAARPDS